MKEIQKAIDEWAQTLEEPYWPPLSQFARLAEEVGEVGRLLNHMYGSKPKKNNEAEQELGGELADVIFALVCIANKHSIDLDEALEKVLEKARIRDAKRFKKKS
ncbi:MAG: nucleotide pyrophosphohydrolase [bacterium]|nr:nucleotide pyrophosphohydrolase [bacterium]